MERTLGLLDEARADWGRAEDPAPRACEQGLAAVGVPDGMYPVSRTGSSYSRRCCSRSRRSPRRGRRTSRRAGTASRLRAQSASIAARVESTRAANVANRQGQVDVALFTQWVDAYAREEDELSAFYRKRFRPEFVPAFDAWVATRPRKNPDAPLSPFAMPEYVLAATMPEALSYFDAASGVLLESDRIEDSRQQLSRLGTSGIDAWLQLSQSSAA